MGCTFSCVNEEDEDGDDVNILYEPRRPEVQRSKSYRSPLSSHPYNVVTEAPASSNNINVIGAPNTVNINNHLQDNINLGASGILLFPGELPEEKIIDLSFKNDKAQFVINLFSKSSKNNRMTLRIKQIREVVNPYLLKMYNLKKEEIISREGHVDELFLFHGTKRKNVTSICEDNLNWRLSGSVTGNRFGQGISLSPKATYASHYCDKDMSVKVMFLMKVLFSKAIIGTKDMVIPKEIKNNQTVYYDTSIKEDCSVVVKYCDNEVYPAYIIYFELV